MKWEDKIFAEKALKRLLIGSQIDGVRFGSEPGMVYIYFAHYSEQDPGIIWLLIEIKKVTVFANLEQLKTASKENLKELDDKESFQLFLENRREKVKDVWLGSESPHLCILLESGKVLYVNGEDENYECWQIGDGYGYVEDEWLVVAVPGKAIAVWSPEEFK